MGGKSFANSLASGVVGIVVKPYEGAQSEGISGFFSGVLKGVAGVISKPVSGALDLVGQTTEGLKNTQKS